MDRSFPDRYARLLRLRPALESALEVVPRVPQFSGALFALTNRAEQLVTPPPLQPDTGPVAVSTARQYLSTSTFPGAVLDLIKLAVTRGAKAGERMDAAQVIATLAQLTGLPVSI